MDISRKSVLRNFKRLTRAGEKKFREGNYKGSLEDKREANSILKTYAWDNEILESFKKELSNLYSSKFDLIKDHKLRINLEKKNQIIKLLKKKSEEKFKKGDYKGAVKALRRSDKYFS